MNKTESLSDGAYRVYHVLCQMMYQADGPIVLNEIGAAGRCKQKLRAFKRNLAELFEAGKIQLIDGQISNERTMIELDLIENNRENAKNGGRISGKSRKSKNNPLNSLSADEDRFAESRSLKDKTQSKKREDSSVAKATAPTAPLFDQLRGDRDDKAEAYHLAESVLGRSRYGAITTNLVKAYGYNYTAVLQCIQRSAEAHDPIAFIHGAIEDAKKSEHIPMDA